MLLQDLQDILDEEEKQKEKDKMEKSQEEAKAVDVRKRALETLTPEKGAKSGSLFNRLEIKFFVLYLLI